MRRRKGRGTNPERQRGYAAPHHQDKKMAPLSTLKQSGALDRGDGNLIERGGPQKRNTKASPLSTSEGQGERTGGTLG